MIRTSAPADLDRLTEIWLSASVLAHDFMPQAFWQSHSEDMRTTYLPMAEVWLVECEGEIQGFVALAEDTLAALFVDPKAQGRGLGTELMNRAKSRRQRLELAVYTANTSALRFYEKQGFAASEKRTDKHTGHPETVMVWTAR